MEGRGIFYARFLSASVCKEPLAADSRRQPSRRRIIIGTDAVARAAPDGYTLLLIVEHPHWSTKTLIPAKPYVCCATSAHHADQLLRPRVVVNPKGRRAMSLEDLLKLARAQPATDYASSGPGTPYHMAVMFKAMAGVDTCTCLTAAARRTTMSRCQV